MSNDETRDQSGNTPERKTQMKSWEVTDEAWEAFDSARDLCSGIQAAFEAGRRAAVGVAPPAPSTKCDDDGCLHYDHEPAPSEDRERLIAEASARTTEHARQNPEGSVDLIRRLADALAAPSPVDESKLAEVIDGVLVSCSARLYVSGEQIARPVREYLDSLRGDPSGTQPG